MGRIWREHGLTLTYDIGALAGNHAQEHRGAGKYLWYKEQTFNGSQAQIVLTSDRTLYVTFPQDTANFYGKVETEQDLTDALLIVMTYHPSPAPPTRQRRTAPRQPNDTP